MNAAPVRIYVVTWLALLTLLALTTASSFIPLHAFNLVANLAIALAKALLVMLVFMRLRRSAPMIRIIAGAGVFWLALLAGLSLLDFAARGS
jgi:cytochrome c oxidase subunit 4